MTRIEFLHRHQILGSKNSPVKKLEKKWVENSNPILKALYLQYIKTKLIIKQLCQKLEELLLSTRNVAKAAVFALWRVQVMS